MKPKVQWSVFYPGDYGGVGYHVIQFYVDLSASERMYFDSLPMTLNSTPADILMAAYRRRDELEAALATYVRMVTT